MKVLGKRAKGVLVAGSLVGVLALIGMGCSSGGGKPNPSNVKQDNLCQQYADIICYNMWNCCTGQELEDILGSSGGGLTLSTSEDKCRTDMKLSCDNIFAQIFDSVSKGTASIDSTKATACLKAILLPNQDNKTKLDPCFIEPTDVYAIIPITTNSGHSMSVPISKDTYDNCLKDSGFIVGAVAATSDCAHDWECVAGTVCSVDHSSGSTSVGKCISFLDSGNKCTDDGQCKEGLYCSDSNGNSSSAGQTCGTAGCTCTALKTDNGKCCDNSECAIDYYCLISRTNTQTCSLSQTGSTFVSGTCKASIAVGQKCVGAAVTGNNLARECYGVSRCDTGTCSNDPKTTCSINDNCTNAGGTTGTGTCNGRVCAYSPANWNYCEVTLNVQTVFQ